jgi:hypothetical protein
MEFTLNWIELNWIESEDDTERLEASDIFKTCVSEGAYEILVRRHLHCNEDKFRDYFRNTIVVLLCTELHKRWPNFKAIQQKQKPNIPGAKTLCIFKVSNKQLRNV